MTEKKALPCQLHDEENKQHNMDNLVKKVLLWAQGKGLLERDYAYKQMLKVMEEVGELSGALVRQDDEEIVDAIGDSFITLIILSKQLNLEPEYCLSQAYDVIAKRSGKTVNGIFIKEEDVQ